MGKDIQCAGLIYLQLGICTATCNSALCGMVCKSSPLGTDTICEKYGGRDWKPPAGERLVVNTFKGPDGGRVFEIEGDTWEIIEEATDINDGTKGCLAAALTVAN